MSNIKLPAVAESTRRALRTFLQGLASVLGLAALVAVPPVADAVNTVLEVVAPGAVIPAGFVVAVGVLLSLVAAAVSKAQNLLEGRDGALDPATIAATVAELTDLVHDALDAIDDARDALNDRDLTDAARPLTPADVQRPFAS